MIDDACGGAAAVKPDVSISSSSGLHGADEGAVMGYWSAWLFSCELIRRFDKQDLGDDRVASESDTSEAFCESALLVDWEQISTSEAVFEGTEPSTFLVVGW